MSSISIEDLLAKISLDSIEYLISEYKTILSHSLKDFFRSYVHVVEAVDTLSLLDSLYKEYVCEEGVHEVL